MGIVLIFTLIYPSFKDSASVLEEIMQNFPEALQKALGLTSMDMSSIVGFYGFVFTYIVLVGSVQAMNLGLSLLANELIDKTADFLMAKPVKRINIVHSKLSAGLINLLVTNICFNIFSIIAVSIAATEGYSLKLLLLFNLSLLLVQLFFFSLGLLISVFMDKMKTVIPISMGVVFAFFVLNLLNESLQDRPLTGITPFAYFSTSEIYEMGSYNTNLLLLNFVFVTVFIVTAYIRYIKKDIPSV
jgi:ABC-2 type transport system permease protein